MLYKAHQVRQVKQSDHLKIKPTLLKMHANTFALRNLLHMTLTDPQTVMHPEYSVELHKSITFLDDLGLTLNRMQQSIK